MCTPAHLCNNPITHACVIHTMQKLQLMCISKSQNVGNVTSVILTMAWLLEVGFDDLIIRETSDLLALLCMSLQGRQRIVHKKQRAASLKKLCFVEGKGLMRMTRLVQAIRMVTVNQITTLYNCHEQNLLSEYTIC